MKIRSTILTVLVLFALVLSASITYGQCDRERDSLVLISILNTNPHLNWDINERTSKWIGVEINRFGCVIELNLNRFGVSEIPDSIGLLNNLRKLDLAQNFILELPEAVGNLSGLQELYLSYNNNWPNPQSLSELPSSIGNLENLRLLDIEGNAIKRFPDSIGNLKQLSILRADHNLIDSLPNSFGRLSNLFQLELSYNNISTLPNSFADLDKLRDLRINKNNISTFPDELLKLDTLHTLDLSDNKIIILPDSIGNIHTLVNFDLGGNRINYVPESIGNISSLYFLDLDNNELTSLPESIGNLAQLRNLYLDNNYINTLPDSYSNLDLFELWLSNNDFIVLPEWIWGIAVRLALDNNNIEYLPDVNVTNSQLMDLFLSDNQIDSFPHGFDLLDLRDLVVYNNRLTFEDFSPNFKDIFLFFYWPQARIFKDTVYYFRVGGNAVIDLATDEDVKNNIHQWFKDSLSFAPDPVNSINSNKLVFPNIQLDDRGIYYTHVTNPEFPELTLESYPITVRVCDPSFDSTQIVLMYESTGGQNWNNNNNWLSSEPIRNWFGITTNAQGCVNKIVLSGNRLTGELPSLELESLDTLIINDNELTGNLPVDLAFPSIEYIDLSDNNFSGTIPDVVSTWMELTNMIIDNNQFRESIPPDIGDLCELEELNLSNNDFEGELPTELTELFNLQIGAVDFSNNMIDSLKSKIIFFCPFGLEILENNPAHPDFVEICERTCSKSEFGSLTDHPWLVDTLNRINCNSAICVGNEVIAEAGFVNVRGVEVMYVRSGCYTYNNEYLGTIILYDCEGNIVDTTLCESNAGCIPFSVTSEEQFAALEYDIRWTCECDSAYCIERDTIVIETGQVDTIEIGEVLQEGLMCDLGIYSLSSVNNELPGTPPMVDESNIGFTYELLTENIISGDQCTTTIEVVQGATGRNEYEKANPDSPVMIACHPNPVVDYLRCPEIDMVNVEEYKVLSIQGMEMPKYIQDYKDKLQLNVQDYPAGMYILLVKTKDRQYLNRFTVIR